MVHEDNEEAQYTLIEKYKFIINKAVSSYRKVINNMGLEDKDLYQEGMIGLIKAIKTYDTRKNALFSTYATKVVENALASAARTAFRQKNKTLNESYSLDIEDDTSKSFYQYIQEYGNDPSIKLINIEEEEYLTEKIKSKLTSFEEQVFNLKIYGFTNDEISTITIKEKKAIENCLNRIKIKYKEVINEQR
ncbi:MAG: sigma-70 family RNA polymerase sigma factor [Bacilli bacterium]